MGQRLNCQECGKEYVIRSEHLGRRFRCKDCGAVIDSQAQSANSYSMETSGRSEAEPIRTKPSARATRRTKPNARQSGGASELISTVFRRIGRILALLVMVLVLLSVVLRAGLRLGRMGWLPQFNGPVAALEDVSPPGSGFSMKLPGEPERQSSLQLLPGAPAAQWQLVLNDGRAFDIGRVALPSQFEADPTAIQNFLNVVRTELAKKVKVLRENQARLDGIEAIEFFHEDYLVSAKEMIRDPFGNRKFGTDKDRVLLGRSRIAIIRGVMWVVFVGRKATQGEMSEADYAGYFDSFHVDPAFAFERPKSLSLDGLDLASGSAPGPAFLERRKTQPAKLTRNAPSPQEFQAESPPPGVRLVSYTSGPLQLSAWYAVPPGKDSSQNPGLVYFHGGMAFGQDDFEVCRPFLDAGFVVMTPMLRGENGNPGHFELLRGEFDDAVNAVRWIAQQPEVDSRKIFTFGHSLGGGLSALLALADNDVPVVLTGSSGGLYSKDDFRDMADICPFDATNETECLLRVLLGNQRDMNRRHLAYLGSQDRALAKNAQLASGEAGRQGLLEVTMLDGDHMTSLFPALDAFLARIENEVRLSAGSNPAAFTSLENKPSKQKLPKNDKPEEDRYGKAPLRSTTPMQTTVGALTSLAMATPPRHWLAISGRKAAFQILDTRTGEVYRSGGHDAGIDAVAFSGNGKYLALGTPDSRVRIYDIHPRSFLVNDPATGGGLMRIIPADESNGFVAATRQHSIVRFEAPQRRGEFVRMTPIGQCQAQITGLQLVSPDSQKLAVTSRDGVLRLFDLRNRSTAAEFELDLGPLTALALMLNGTQAVVGSEQGAVVINLATGEAIKSFSSWDQITSAAYTPGDGMSPPLVAIGDAFGRVLLVNADSGTAESACMGCRSRILELSFSSDGRALVAISEENPQLAVWDLTKPTQSRQQQPGGLPGRFFPQGVFAP